MATSVENAVTNVIRWNDYYSVGDPHLDGQHREIISLANRLYELLGTESPGVALPAVLRRLVEYTQVHFQDEEKVMRRVGFPHLDAHKRLHEQLTQEIFDMQFRCLQTDAPEPREVLLFVKKWWIDHITGADKQYMPYVLADQPHESGLAEIPAPEETAQIDPEVVQLLDAMIENERRIGCYYEALVDLIPEHAATWQRLGRQEEGHAVALVDVRRAVEKVPHRVSIGRFTTAAARLMTEEVGEMIEKIQRGEVHPRYALSFITDIEQSLLEHEVDQALTTDVAEVRTILKKLKQETVAHRATLHGIAL